MPDDGRRGEEALANAGIAWLCVGKAWYERMLVQETPGRICDILLMVSSHLVTSWYRDPVLNVSLAVQLLIG
jgi:hypothetical protein